MNIPYAQFYRAETSKNNISVDAFTSATRNKTRTVGLSGGSYHVDSEGSEITGITFPVKVAEGADLSAYRQVTDSDSVEITVTNRGQTSTTVCKGKDALYESATYSYYVLSEKPSYYKEMILNSDGSFSFGKTVGTHQTVSGLTGDLSTETSYGDYQLDITGLREIVGDGAYVYGVVVYTTDGTGYGMRHLENIWRVEELAWCTGFTDTVHNCPTSSAHYKSMMGKTISSAVYYTSTGIYDISLGEIYVPVKFDSSALSVEDAVVTSGKTTVTLPEYPSDYKPSYSVDGLDVKVSGNELTFSNAQKGKYTLVVSDLSGKYADLTADFILYTEEMPAVYNEDGSAPALVKAKDASDEEFADYLANISAVTVNGKRYAASGKGAVKVIKEDGTIDTETAPFAEGTQFEMIVESTGYTELSFTYVKKVPTGNTDNNTGNNTGDSTGNKPGTDSNAGTGNKPGTNSNAGSKPGTNSGTGTLGSKPGSVQNAYSSVKTGDFTGFSGIASMAVVSLVICGICLKKRKMR